MERLQQIEEIFQEALQRDPAGRDAYVRQACHGDTDLAHEVSSLLANHKEAGRCESWPAAAAAQLIDIPCSLRPGQSLGPYQIESFIAAGGMGEVYRATDTRLHREVAIKVSSAQFTERFEREARTIASLNHPNICQLYDVGPNYLVMELVEGPTVAYRIKQGALPPDDALGIARQIAEALEAAHEKGKVHRDLKPANIKITPGGVVKVLDFGLAKAAEEPAATADPSDSPTQTLSATRTGVILGTAAYMSPEQARGAVVDKRADIWAFGCVLYEMLTGRRAFSGETTSDILASVLKEEPDWSRIPARVQPLLRRCLVKDPKHRLRDIGDAMPLLDAVPEPVPARRPWPWVVAATLAIGFAVLALAHFREVPPEAQVMITSIVAPENTSFEVYAASNPPALSPDGRRIVFRARGTDGRVQLWLRPLDSALALPLAGTEEASSAFWSPDSRSIAFYASGKLRRMDVTGGPIVTVAEASGPLSGAWSPHGIIVFALPVGPLMRVPASGGAPTAATTLAQGHVAHRFPWFLPDGRHFIFTDQTQPGAFEMTLRVGELDSKEVKTIGPTSSNAIYASGYLLYLHGSTLVAQPFDENRLATTGEAVPVAEQVRTGQGGVVTIPAGVFSVSHEGLLAYLAGETETQQLTWFDRGGKQLGTLGDAGTFWSIEFSPDRKHVAVSTLGPAQDIWIYDVARGLSTRLTFGPAAHRNPVWSHDGRSIIFNSNAKGQFDLYRKAADGTGSEELLYADGQGKIPSSWSPDGNFFLYQDPGHTWVLPLGAQAGPGATLKPFSWLDTPYIAASAKFSPDGRWVAYASNESGRAEIYVAPFPGPGGKRQISTGGGTFPRWRADGNEIFYVGLNGTVMAAGVSIKGEAVELKAIRSLGIPVAFPVSRYDVSLDGQRFLVATPQEQKTPARLTLIQNWTALLKKK